MVYKGRIKIDFYNTSQASIQIWTTSPIPLSRFTETLLISSYTLRQMYNLGINHIVTTSLARSLIDIKDSLAPIKLMLGPPSLSKQDIQKLTISSNPLAIARYVTTNEIQIVEKRLSQGKKRFDGILKFTESVSRFTLNVKGFGMMGEGINYYVPLSVAILLNYLANMRNSDSEYLAVLTNIASKCGESALDHQISLNTLLTLPIILNNAAWASHGF